MMQTKKKTAMGIMCVFMMMLSAIAIAQQYYTAPEVAAQVQDGWHEIYEAYGRSIEVDTEIMFPNVEAVPVLKVEFARMTAETTTEETGWYIKSDPKNNIFIYSIPNYQSRAKTHDKVVYGYPDMDKVYTAYSEITPRMATDFIRDTLHTMKLDDNNWDFNSPYEMTTSHFVHSKTEKDIDTPGEYSMFFHQVIRDIPVLCHAGSAFNLKTRSHPTIQLRTDVADENGFWVSIKMIKETEVVYEDIPLCSFDVVKKSIEKEISDGHIRKVYELEFGYVLYDDSDYAKGEKGNSGHYYAVPAWKLNCLYMTNRKKELPDYTDEDATAERYSLQYKTLVFNAQTGKMLDFMSEKTNRARYKDVITWNKVK